MGANRWGWTRVWLAAGLLGGACLGAEPGEGSVLDWPLQADQLTAPGGAANVGVGVSYSVFQEGGGIVARLRVRGRVLQAGLPAPLELPLDGAVRLRDPWATLADLARHPALENLGWNLWDSRPASVRAAAAGVVLGAHAEAGQGIVVEIGHGAGLRTRYALGRYGSCTVAAGVRVAAGEAIGALGAGLPDDIPFVHFGLLLETGPGELLALDPAPFFFATAAHRRLPFAASVLNSAVRSGRPEAVERLLRLGLDPNGRAVDGTRPLEWAVMRRDGAMARLLAEAGADPGLPTAEGVGTLLPGVGPTINRTGPTLLELAREAEDPELLAALGH